MVVISYCFFFFFGEGAGQIEEVGVFEISR